MRNQFDEKIQWFANLWRHSEDPSVQAYRVHVRGLVVGWAVTAAAMLLVERFPNEARLTMYDMLRTPGLPWQQHGLAALELAAPLVMFWHLFGLHRWGMRRAARS
jgi:hypothetical protein